MAYSVVQTASNSGTGTTVSVTLSSVTSNNTIVVGIITAFTAFSAPTSITDSQGNWYTRVAGPTTVSNGSLYTYVGGKVTGGFTSLTVNFSGSGQNNAVIVREYSGVVWTPFDVSAAGTGNSTALSSGATVTTRHANQIVVGIGTQTLNSVTLSAGSGFSNLTQYAGGSAKIAIEDKEVTSLGTQTTTMTSSQSWNWAMHAVTLMLGTTQRLTISGEGTHTPVGWGDEGGTYTRVTNDDGDTNRLYTPTNGSTRSLTHTATSGLGSATINSVVIAAKLRALNPIDTTNKLGVRISGTNYLSGNIVNNGTSYQVINTVYGTSPATSAAWTASGVDAAEFLIQKADANGNGWTFAYVDVNYTAGDTTTTKDQTGKARIQVTATRDITGKSNIASNVVTTTKTQTGKASILNTASQTQTGKASILKTTTQDITGKANLLPPAVTVTKDIEGRSSISSTGGSTSSTFYVNSSSDDAAEDSSGAMNLSATASVFNYNNHFGIRFNNVTIAQGATVNNAYFRFPQLQTYTGTGAINGNIYGQAIDNAPSFGVSTNDITSRSRTTATVANPAATTAWTVDNSNQGINITSIIQEIVNRSGWASGNSIVILLIGNGNSAVSNSITPYTYDYISGYYAEELRVTVGGGDVAYTRYQYGKARIAPPAVNQDITGKARIETSVSKPQLGTARVTATTQQAQTGVAKISLPVTQDQTGKARITVTSTAAQTGKSRITASTSQLQTGKARITASTQQVQVGQARITVSTTQAQTGKSNIQATTQQNQSGISRITATTLRVQTGIARIALVTAQNQTGISRITASTQQLQTGTARIANDVQRTQTGISRITQSVPQSQTGVSRIQVSVTRTQTGLARITATSTKDQTGKSSILNSVTRAQAGQSRITASTTRDITGTAKITSATNRDQLGRAAILNAVTRDQTGTARITYASQRLQTGIARITASAQQIITGTSRITQVVTRNQTGKANIGTSYTQPQTGVSRIQVQVQRNQTGTARIEKVGTATQTGKARITVEVQRDQTGKASIRYVQVRDQLGKAAIAINAIRTITGKARIEVATTRNQTGRAAIINQVQQNQTGKAAIRKSVSRDIYGKALIMKGLGVTVVEQTSQYESRRESTGGFVGGNSVGTNTYTSIRITDNNLTAGQDSETGSYESP